MLWYVLFTICLFFSLYSIAQPNSNSKLYILDSSFNSVQDAAKSAHILKVTKWNDTTYTYYYYSTFTLRAEVVETYTDEEGTNANGHFIYYNFDGSVDSMGYVKNGARHNHWYYYKNFATKSDSLIEKKWYNNGVLGSKPNEPQPTHKVETEARFDGKFRYFLEKNLKYPKPAQDAQFTGTPISDFTVTKEGKIEDIFIRKSVNFYLDMEAIRVILLSSGKWISGTINGEKVNSFHRQSIGFLLGSGF